MVGTGPSRQFHSTAAHGLGWKAARSHVCPTSPVPRSAALHEQCREPQVSHLRTHRGWVVHRRGGWPTESKATVVACFLFSDDSSDAEETLVVLADVFKGGNSIL